MTAYNLSSLYVPKNFAFNSRASLISLYRRIVRYTKRGNVTRGFRGIQEGEYSGMRRGTLRAVYQRLAARSIRE